MYKGKAAEDSRFPRLTLGTLKIGTPEIPRDVFQFFAGLCESGSSCMLWVVNEAKLYGKFGGEFEVKDSLHFRNCLCDCRSAGRGGLGAIYTV